MSQTLLAPPGQRERNLPSRAFRAALIALRHGYILWLSQTVGPTALRHEGFMTTYISSFYFTLSLLRVSDIIFDTGELLFLFETCLVGPYSHYHLQLFALPRLNKFWGTISKIVVAKA